jgi:hypothetical protein
LTAEFPFPVISVEWAGGKTGENILENIDLQKKYL